MELLGLLSPFSRRCPLTHPFVVTVPLSQGCHCDCCQPGICNTLAAAGGVWLSDSSLSLSDAGCLLVLVPTRMPSLPSSTQAPSGSSTAQCLGGSSSSSSHTNPKSMARSPFTVVTGSKVSVCQLSSASGAGASLSPSASVDPLGGQGWGQKDAN